MTPAEEVRLVRLEAKVDVLTRALHLLTVSAKPTSQWLDAKMAVIDGSHDVAISSIPVTESS